MATKRREPAWLTVACPTCGAEPGQRCNWIGDPCSLPCGEEPGTVERPHAARQKAGKGLDNRPLSLGAEVIHG